MSQQIRKLGYTYKDLVLWIWLSVFLFWLLFPPIILLIKQFQLYSDMKAAGEAHNDQPLKDAADKQLLILILYLASAITGITGIIALILEIINLSDLSNWARSRNIPAAADGYNSVKTGIILSAFLGWLIIPLIIGIIMITSGYSKVGNTLSL